MAVVTGALIFDADRSGEIDFRTNGAITNTPLVLQSTDGSFNTVATLTDGVGDFEFFNVPAGNYKISVVDGYTGLITPSPADFATAAKPEKEITQGKVPSYKNVLPADRRTKGMNALNAVLPTTLYITVTEDAPLDDVYFYIGPALYKNYILDKCSSLSPNNLISAGDNGTFGDVEIGSEPNSGPATNPYSNSSLMSDFTWIKQSNEIPIGDYTIGNTTKPYNESELYDWWRLSDHTTSIETGRMQIVGGNSSNKKALSTTLNNLEKNTTYLFTAWVASLNKNQSPSDSKVGVTVDGLDTHTPLYSNLNHMISTDPKLPIWQEIGVKFNTGENTSVSLNMLSVAPMYFFAIDDIKLRKVTNLCRTTSGSVCDNFCVTNCVNKHLTCVGDILTFNICIYNTSEFSMGSNDYPIIFSNVLSDCACFIPNTLLLNNMPLSCINLCNINLGIFKPYELKTIVFSAFIQSNFQRLLTSCAKVIYIDSDSNICCTNNTIAIMIL